MYLATCTRPDIAYAVGTLAKFSSKPNQTQWLAAKRVLQYLKGTSNLGIIFKGDEPESCKAYSDADWAGDKDDRKSTSGYLFKIAGGPVSYGEVKSKTLWLSQPQKQNMLLYLVPHRSVSG